MYGMTRPPVAVMLAVLLTTGCASSIARESPRQEAVTPKAPAAGGTGQPKAGLPIAASKRPAAGT